MKILGLPIAKQILVCVGVLLDKDEVVHCLATDEKYGTQLVEAAKELRSLSVEERVPLIGSLLRHRENIEEVL